MVTVPELRKLIDCKFLECPTDLGYRSGLWHKIATRFVRTRTVVLLEATVEDGAEEKRIVGHAGWNR